jgi:hypothetical protein
MLPPFLLDEAQRLQKLSGTHSRVALAPASER